MVRRVIVRHRLPQSEWVGGRCYSLLWESQYKGTLGLPEKLPYSRGRPHGEVTDWSPSDSGRLPGHLANLPRQCPRQYQELRARPASAPGLSSPRQLLLSGRDSTPGPSQRHGCLIPSSPNEAKCSFTSGFWVQITDSGYRLTHCYSVTNTSPHNCGKTQSCHFIPMGAIWGGD